MAEAQMTNSQHREWLRQMLQEYEIQKTRAQAILSAYETLIVSTSSMLETLDAVESGQIHGPLSLNIHTANTVLDTQPTTKGLVPSALLRQQEFLHITLGEAIKQILDAYPEKIWHLEDIAHAIFFVRDEQELRFAKRMLSSELSRGVRQGLWGKISRGCFRAIAATEPAGQPLAVTAQPPKPF